MCCNYEPKFYWDDWGEQHTFECLELPLQSGYCIFHDEKFLDDPSNGDIVKQEFMKRITEGLENKRELLFIGFIPPDLELHDIVVENNIYFMYARFRGLFSIQNC